MAIAPVGRCARARARARAHTHTHTHTHTQVLLVDYPDLFREKQHVLLVTQRARDARGLLEKAKADLLVQAPCHPRDIRVAPA